ncbi:MAG TPA: SGNH/GDSL hydrolase family protein [Humidesulfovibrio sp.]|uniref:SGNH/GDSL hydrolase family protein n=1 Tax=Humidesulfovibrio sp. TaxID=2910988 RepID=UPI002B762AFB|nr:SGNH/GDSL hydrolase family protein [Humidesulfovibrio sp.]HWR02584.1 SGNH/GDSL hydrolase family protein [Humidesulfovibrio sp.]
MPEPQIPETTQPRRPGVLIRSLTAAWQALRLLVLAVIMLEVCCCVVVTTMNYVIYGKSREGSRIVYDSLTLYTSAEGLRETTPAPAARPGTERVIWFLGGSTMRGDSTDAAHTLPSIICRELSKDMPCVCLNLGVNSFNTLQEVQQLQKAQLERERWPDLIVFLDGANDTSYAIVGRSANAHEGYARIKGYVESYWSTPFGVLKPLIAAAYASFTWELYSRLTYALEEIGADSPLPGQVGQAMRARYDYVDRTARGMNARFLAFLQPLAWQEAQAGGIPEAGLARRLELLPVMRANFSRMYGGMEAALQDRPYFVNLRGVFVGRDFIAYEPDGIHNTDQGREVLAQAMLPAIRSALAR